MRYKGQAYAAAGEPDLSQPLQVHGQLRADGWQVDGRGGGALPQRGTEVRADYKAARHGRSSGGQDSTQHRGVPADTQLRVSTAEFPLLPLTRSFDAGGRTGRAADDASQLT